MEAFRKNALATVARYHAALYRIAPPDVQIQTGSRLKLFSEMARRPRELARLLYRTLDGFDREPLGALFAACLLPEPASEPVAGEGSQTKQNYFPLQKLQHPASVEDFGLQTVTLRFYGEMAYQSLQPYFDALATAETVFLQINSPGGDSRAALELCEALKGKHVEACVNGIAFSSAAVLLQSGTIRRMTEGSRLMVHSPISFLFGGPGELRREAARLEADNEKFIGLFHRSDPAVVRKWFADGDHFFSATEAKAAGLIDEILPEPTPEGDLVAALARELLGRLRATMGDDPRFFAILKELA